MRGFCDLPQPWKERLYRAITESYDRIVDTAIAREVDFVVLSGDAFDTSQPSYGDYLHFFEGLERLRDAGIPVYMIAGNHDPLTTWQGSFERLPENVRMFRRDSVEFALFERDDQPVCVMGARGYRNQSWPLDDPISRGIGRAEAIEALSPAHPRCAEAPFSIGIVHTGLNQDQSKAFSDPQALIGADVDYWACGHLHERLCLPDEQHPKVVFPGCVQARDIKESGERGCYVVEMSRIDSRSAVTVKLDFVPTASVAFDVLEVDVSTCQTLADVIGLVQTESFQANANVSCDEMVVRVELTGETDLHRFLSRPDVIRDLKKRLNNAFPTFYYDTLIDRTNVVRNRDAIMREGLFPAHALQVSSQQRSHDDEMINYIQSEFVKRGIEMPASLAGKIDCYGQRAEAIVLDMLEEERS